MSEKKTIKVSIGTVVCLFIITILIIVLCITYYLGFLQQKQIKTGNTGIEENIVSNEVSTEEEKENLSENVVQEEKTNEIVGRELIQNELDLFEKYLEAPGIWNFIYTPYNDLTEFKLYSFLKYFYSSREATAEEIKDITGEDNRPVPMHLFDKIYIDEYFKEHTGKDVSIIKSEFLPAYSEKYHCYYNGTSDTDGLNIDVISGREYNNKYVIRYTNNNYKFGEITTFELTLNKVNGEYLFVSNIALDV